MHAPPRVEQSRRFSPRRRATPGRRAAALFLLGPLLWVAALTAVALTLREGQLVEVGLLIAALSFAAALALLVPARLRRVREEQRA